MLPQTSTITSGKALSLNGLNKYSSTHVNTVFLIYVTLNRLYNPCNSSGEICPSLFFRREILSREICPNDIRLSRLTKSTEWRWRWSAAQTKRASDKEVEVPFPRCSLWKGLGWITEDCVSVRPRSADTFDERRDCHCISENTTLFTYTGT